MGEGMVEKKVSRPRARLYALVVTALFVLLIEGLSYVGYLAWQKKAFHYREQAELRARQVAAAAAVRKSSSRGSTPIVPHPFVGFVYDPNYDPEGTKKYHSIPASPWGYLDDKNPIRAKSDDEVTIGLFGGSVAFWLSVQGDGALFEELAQVPAFRGKRLVLVRTALGGAKQPQQLASLNYLLALGGHFDVVINLDGLNEVAIPPGNVAKGTFAHFPNDWPSLLGQAGDPAVLRLIGEISLLERERGERAQFFSKPILRHSVFANVLWRLLDRRLAGRLSQARLALHDYRPSVEEASPISALFAARGPHRQYSSPELLFEEIAEVWQRSSLLMRASCEANGIRYFHFLQPNQYHPGSKPLGEAEKKIALWPGSGYETGVVQGYPKLLKAGAGLKARGVEFHDLTQLYAGENEPIYIDACCHVNHEGNRRLGQEIGRIVRKALG